MTGEQISELACKKPPAPEDKRPVWLRALRSLRVRVEPKKSKGRIIPWVSIKGGVEF